MTSIARENLLTKKGYTPYCGAFACPQRWPRTKFNGTQFECRCGWKSNFEAEFIKQHQVAQEALKAEDDARRAIRAI